MMTNVSATARALATNLRAKSIPIKHVQALDLIAAGAGLANRHVLATLPDVPKIARINLALLTSAATVLARHDLGRRITIVNETIAVLTPAAEQKPDEIIEIEFCHLSITQSEFANPDAFLATDRGRRFLERLTSELYYTRYEPDRNVMRLSAANKLAEAILDAKRSADGDQGQAARMAVAGHFGFGYELDDYWWNEAREKVGTILERVETHLRDEEIEVSFDPDDWLSSLEDRVLDILESEDDSEATDLICSADCFEAVFIFKPEGYVIDQMVSSNKAWPDFADLHVGPELQHGLASLGYSIADYRRISGNRNPSEDLLRGLKKRPQPLLDPEQLREIVENACSQNFLFAIYAIVPVQDLLDLDLAKPITFSQAAIATYNPFSGTFHEVTPKQPVTVEPNEGELFCGGEYVSPDAICGFYTPVFKSFLNNEASPTKELVHAA